MYVLATILSLRVHCMYKGNNKEERSFQKQVMWLLLLFRKLKYVNTRTYLNVYLFIYMYIYLSNHIYVKLNYMGQ